jgi:hypothetical protein
MLNAGSDIGYVVLDLAAGSLLKSIPSMIRLALPRVHPSLVSLPVPWS